MLKCYLYFCGLCLRPWSTYLEAGRRVFYSNKLCEDYRRHSIKRKFTSQFRTVWSTYSEAGSRVFYSRNFVKIIGVKSSTKDDDFAFTADTVDARSCPGCSMRTNVYVM